MSTEARAIRDAIVERLAGLNGHNEDVRTTPVPQWQPTDLPQISVYILSEDLIPDGDDNVGEPAFVSDIRIGISAMRGFDLNDAQDTALDGDSEAIRAALLQDPDFVNCGPDSLFESVPAWREQRMFPQDGEAYFAELRIEATFRVRVDYPPMTPDDFLRLRQTTRLAGVGEQTPTLTTDTNVRTGRPWSTA